MTEAAVFDQDATDPDPFQQRLRRHNRTTRIRAGRDAMVVPAHLASDPQVLTAAAQRIDTTSKRERDAAEKRRQPWQSQAWALYDELGFVGRAGDWYADCMSRLRWFPGYVTDDDQVVPLDATEKVVDPRTGEETDVPILSTLEQANVRDAFDRFRNPEQTFNELMRGAALNIFCVGECWILSRLVPAQVIQGEEVYPEHERWDVVSESELVADRDGKWKLRKSPPAKLVDGKPGMISNLGGGEVEELPEEGFFLLRVWNRHPRFREWANCALRRVVMEGEEYKILTGAIKATALSRYQAKVLVMDERASFAEGDREQAGPENRRRRDKVAQGLIDHGKAPIEDPTSVASVAPHLLRTDLSKEGAKPFVLDLSRESGVDQGSREELKRTILESLPVSVETIMGLGDTSTYANARLVTEQDFDIYLAPGATMLAHAVSTGMLQSDLRERGMANWDRFVIWYDPAELVGKPGALEGAVIAYDRGEADGDYLRQAAGIPDEAKPDPEELAERQARERPQIVDVNDTDDPNQPALAAAAGMNRRALPTVARQAEHRLARVATPQLVAAVNADAQRVAVLGAELARVEQRLRVRVQVTLSGLVNRALDRASSKIVSKARGRGDLAPLLRQVPKRDVFATLGPALTASLGADESEAIADVINGGREEITSAIARAQAEAVRRALQVGDIDDTDLQQIHTRQEEDRNAGWLLLAAAALLLTQQRMFDPKPDAPPIGEHDTTLIVPVGTIREGLAVAGGAQGTTTTTGTVVDAAGEPVGGVTDGVTALDIFNRVGILPAFYIWRTGDPLVPFEPHQDLDGVEFDGWEDDQLANYDVWPEFGYYYPGDHLGCQCSFERGYRLAEDAA